MFLLQKYNCAQQCHHDFIENIVNKIYHRILNDILLVIYIYLFIYLFLDLINARKMERNKKSQFIIQ